ncbi:arylsulfatase [Rhodococcus sp. IEGM 1379]|uniref:arylsulfatase n=1 Tax=Rhodococcus sp. IEGM 1379 TaxID=3047086 RepID=UPI0024B66EAB|nr:arylsulfatase [Rhodococcus sp. IEGM 1379]MDI9914232.1 arylsulfatase [Rhodococcus sp. IEGM 1379]
MNVDTCTSTSGSQRREPSESDAPKWPVPVSAPASAPNVLVIMTDDVGYGASSTFGGPIPTPALDGLAETGLRYTQFHTTAMCSPTRAALMTGRNHHKVGAGRVTEMALAYDGYTSIIPDSAATVAEMLRCNGYSTAQFGKYHNVPVYETGPAGPFDHWPTNMGFQHFYGYLGGSTDNWAPALYEGTSPVEPPTDDATYHLENDLANKAITWIRRQKSAAPNKPVYIQYSNAATHAPHHAPRDWIDRFRGQFDQGWDAIREETIARQKQLGVIPADTELTERPEQIASWDSLTADHQKVAARMMEVYAGALAYADSQIGRVLEELERIGELDNTLVFYIQGDNGASPEGGANGSLNEMSYVNRMEDSIESLLEHLDELGGPLHYNHFPAGWAHATDTPFKWFKMVASHFGGTRNGMVLSHAARITDAGGIRTQFHHVIDVVPTILEVIGIEAPKQIRGAEQMPLCGVPMAYTFDDPAAPSTRTTQYFELMGNLAIYSEGWVAATTPREMPWEFATGADSLDDVNWELYHVENDYSQSDDLSAQYPDKLGALVDLFWEEAEANQVLPVIVKALNPGPPKPNPTFGLATFVYYDGVTRVTPGSAPDVTNKPFSITADVVLTSNHADGMLLSQGGRFGGHALYLANGVLTYHYNLLGRERSTVTSEFALPAGRHQLVAVVDIDPTQRGGSAAVTLLCDDEKVGSGTVANTAPFRLNYIEGLSVGRDTGTPVSEQYQLPFAFDGVLDKVTVTLD